MTVLLRLALTAVVLSTGTATAQERFAGKVVGVTDGDTVSVMRNGRAVTVRLDGIDCPERGQDFGQRATRFTSELVFGKEATIDVADVDRYGRLVGRAYVSGTDVSLAIVRAGLAWHYKQYSNDRALEDAEVDARSRRVGLWSYANPIPPWEYRHPTRVESASQRGPFHGNRRSGVFHRPGCPNYDCANCLIVFRSQDEAARAGFRPAGDCLR